ncbi:serine hydrolase [Bradyrhizobium sp. NAS96.2]|uniref:serine hydrolase domain-containing protein n=1 Tax=Bradyrhizobium sp. NAS96.2 TaxID=1680160 RepID=UPI000938AB41|nr:serine hydrolase [Bradyrhizobium sp. NAS96.2]OKO79237.1 beta-lactamase [Bradyrhizobium sp. NAS96.2]
MNSRRIMAAFPSAADEQVTLANWRQHPYNEWAFRNVRELLPTANIARAAAPAPLSFAPRYLDDVSFADPRGETVGVGQALRASHTDGIVVSHRGQVVFEWYAHGLTPDTPHLIFSVSKSVAGTLGGILADHGKLDPDAPVTRYIPEMEGSVYGGSCTVRHLLDMSVGIRFDEDYMARDGDIMNYRRSTGWEPPDPAIPPSNLRDYLRTLRPNGAPHGETFHYVSTNTDVLGWVYERACGMSYAKILSQYLWQPMGAEHDAYITVDSRGAARVAGGICATVRDLARFGEMMRNHGISNGRQVVPGWWVDDIRQNGNAEAWSRGDLTKVFPNGNYRNKWYTLDRGETPFAAVGIHGQWIYIDPANETVIARVSSQPLPMDLDLDHMWMRGYRAIAVRLAGKD